MTRPAWVARAGDAVQLKIWVQPRASKDAIVGDHGGFLKVRITSPPIDDRANLALCLYLSRVLGVRPGAVRVKSGSSNRLKTIEVIKADADVVVAALRAQMEGR